MPQLSQFVDPLERAAPARTAVIDLIQSAPVITAVVTYFQSLCFGDTPVHQRILLIFDPLRLICRDADIVECLILPLKPIDLLADKMGFKLSRTPSDLSTGPAVAGFRWKMAFAFLPRTLGIQSLLGDGAW